MFTGIIKAAGIIVKIPQSKRGGLLTVKTAPDVVRQLSKGASVSVEGVCLTALHRPKGVLEFELMKITLEKTTLGQVKVNAPVNLEPALLYGEPLGGNFVTGHVDGIGRVKKISAEGSMRLLKIQLSKPLTRYLVPQGSVVVNGVALTVVSVGPDWFSVALTPYTAQHTNLGELRVNDPVNLEVDMLAKQIEKFLHFYALRHHRRRI